MPRDAQRPGSKLRVWLERTEAPPQREACFLEHIVGSRMIVDQRANIRQHTELIPSEVHEKLFVLVGGGFHLFRMARRVAVWYLTFLASLAMNATRLYGATTSGK